MQVPCGGPRTQLTLVAILLAGVLFAGCTTQPPEDNGPEVPEGHGLVTLWMSRPANAAEQDVQVLSAVPRLIVFTPADNETAQRVNATTYIDVAEGWYEKEGGWDEDEWPKNAKKDWLKPYDIWYQGAIPVGNYSKIRIEIMDQHIVLWNSQPDLRIGNRYESNGEDRLTFQPDPSVGTFQVQEDEELVLNFQTTLDIERDGLVIIR